MKTVRPRLTSGRSLKTNKMKTTKNDLMKFKGTKGDLTVHFSDKWPFYIEILDESGECVHRERLLAHSTQQNSFEDARRAVGFEFEERKGIRDMIEKQIADAHIRAAAPNLLDILIYVYGKMTAENYTEEDFEKVESIINKALGK